jgi:hypothetical protein
VTTVDREKVPNALLTQHACNNSTSIHLCYHRPPLSRSYANIRVRPRVNRDRNALPPGPFGIELPLTTVIVRLGPGGDNA